jgi:hypothetical protein
MAENSIPSQEGPKTMQQRAAEVCKACMLGDKETLVQHTEQYPELVNHADEQVRTSANTHESDAFQISLPVHLLCCCIVRKCDSAFNVHISCRATSRCIGLR